MLINKIFKTVALTSVPGRLGVLGGVLGRPGAGIREPELGSPRTKEPEPGSPYTKVRK